MLRTPRRFTANRSSRLSQELIQSRRSIRAWGNGFVRKYEGGRRRIATKRRLNFSKSSGTDRRGLILTIVHTYTRISVYTHAYIYTISASLGSFKTNALTNIFLVFSDDARVWVSIVSLPKGRYLLATSWKLVRFGFPGSYIANLVRSRGRRNDRFDRSWIPPIFPIPFHHARVRWPFPFFLYTYRRTYIPCRLFLSAQMGLYDVPSSSCRTLRDLSSRPVYPCFSDFCPDRILYIGKTTDGNAISNHSISLPLFTPARIFSTAKLLAGILTSADSHRYKFPLETHVPLVFWLSFLHSSLYSNSRLFDRKVTESKLRLRSRLGFLRCILKRVFLFQIYYPI